MRYNPAARGMTSDRDVCEQYNDEKVDTSDALHCNNIDIGTDDVELDSRPVFVLLCQDIFKDVEDVQEMDVGDGSSDVMDRDVESVEETEDVECQYNSKTRDQVNSKSQSRDVCHCSFNDSVFCFKNFSINIYRLNSS